MASLVDVVGLGPLLDEAAISPARRANFEELYSSLTAEAQYVDLRGIIELKIKDYFDDIELPRQVTLYDELLATLRRKDLIASFNWDPLLIEAFRRNRGLPELPEIVFLHGNVGVGVCIEHRRNGFFGGSCGQCRREYEQSSLLYPVAEKRYHEDAFISSQWARLEKKLHDAFIVTIFGYSAPVSDVSAREIMHHAWNANGSRTLAEIEIIDIRPKRELLKSWKPFITGDHYSTMRRISESLAFRFPRRSCDAWGWAVLQNDPWRTRPLPKFETIEDLHRWCAPLVEEELAYYDRGAALTQWR
jgi:hypothetical protein